MSFKTVILALVLGVLVLGCEFVTEVEPESSADEVIKESPHVRFERLMGLPVPHGVSVQQIFGEISLAGGEEGIIFMVSQETLNQIVEVMEYDRYTISDNRFEGAEDSFVAGVTPLEIDDFSPNVAYFLKGSAAHSYGVLYFEEAREKAVYFRFRL